MTSALGVTAQANNFNWLVDRFAQERRVSSRRSRCPPTDC